MEEEIVTEHKVFSLKTHVQLRKLAEIVANKHFSYIPREERQDLITEGVLKGLSLLNDAKFDSTRSSLKNYIYSGMRNEMTNYLYRNKKEYPTEEFPVLQAEVSSAPEFDLADIENVTVRFIKRYGDYTGLVAGHLVKMGFHIDGLEGLKDINKPRITDEGLLEKMLAGVIWQRQVYSL